MSPPLAPRVKREDLEPGEINNSKLRHDVMTHDDVMMDTKQPRNEQGHSPSVHSIERGTKIASIAARICYVTDLRHQPP